jgi:DNA relaxase NicK
MTSIELIRSGIDWLTVTLGRDSPMADFWYLKAKSSLHLFESEGYKPKDKQLLGYYGKAIGGCFVGERHDGYMAQFSGHHADQVFWQVNRSDMHTARIDLRVDVTYTEMPNDIARKGFDHVLRANKELPVQRQRKCYLLMGSDGGDTLYLGAPTSEQRGRLYNKERESHHVNFNRTWRYECIYRNDSAARVVDAIREGEQDYSRTVLAIVASWWGNRGVPVSQWGRTASIPIRLTRTLPTDVEKRLSWIRAQVAPALRWLEEAGASNDMIEALGIMKRLE